MIALIVAIGNENVIGYQGKMPWGRIPLDLQRFKVLTMGRPIVMGYRTLVSVAGIFPKGKIFPGRTSFVLTREPRKVDPFKECVAIQNIDFVFEIAERDCVYIIGGGNVYHQFINRADVAYITRINADFKGDAFFPPFPTDDWNKLGSEHVHDGEYDLSFETWARGHKRSPIIQEELTKFSNSIAQGFELVTRLR